MPTKALGPGRQIADKSYYLNELRIKSTEIQTEIKKMVDEHAKYMRDSTSYATLERKYESVVKDVRALEGQLADFNLAVDKVRTNTPVHEIQHLFDRIRAQNDYDRKQVDEIFMRTQMNHKQAQNVERTLGDMHQKATERLATLGEDLANEYQELSDEQAQLQSAIQAKQQESRELDRKIYQFNADLKSPEYQIHNKGMQLSKRRKQLLAEKQDLDEEVNSSLTPQEQRDRILQKIKDATAECNQAEKKQKQLTEQHEKIMDDIREREQDVAEAKKHAQKAKKYEALFDRDRKMQEFIDRYPESKRAEQSARTRLQETIVVLLRHVSKQIDAQSTLPNQEKLQEMKSELSFKEKKMQNSKDTLGHLTKELEKRKEELDKIVNLDKKINNELTTLKTKIAQMKAEQVNFKPQKELEEEAQLAKAQLVRDKAESKKQRDAIKMQVQMLSGAYEKRKKETSNTDVMKRIDSLEQKLRAHATTVYKLSDYISTHRRESDYEAVSKETSELTKEINAWSMAQVNAKPS